MTFKKGKPGGPGRPKGRLNNFTYILNDFLAVWNSIDGKTRLEEYLARHPEKIITYAQLIAGLMPRQIGLDISTSPPVTMRSIQDDSGKAIRYQIGQDAAAQIMGQDAKQIPEVEIVEEPKEEPKEGGQDEQEMR